MERTRELFENAVVSSSDPQLYLEYAKFEEEYGLAKRAMEVYREATRKVAEDIHSSCGREIRVCRIEGGLQGSDRIIIRASREGCASDLRRWREALEK